MTDELYTRLADALDRLPNGFPRTPSGIEIQLLRKIFTPEEATLAAQLGVVPEPVDVLAARLGLPVGEAASKLIQMARRGLVWYDRQSNKRSFRLAPFVVGIYEAQLETMDDELARLTEQYMDEGGAVGIMQPQPALQRVIPAQASIKSDWVLPYDDVRAVLLAAKSFRVRDCICRVQQAHLDHACSKPAHVCLSFSSAEGAASPDSITQAEALALLEKTEEAGLVHTVSNVREGMGYICNCCGCCCGILRGITQYGIAQSVARASYVAVIDADECLNCGACVDRCQVQAISDQTGITAVDQVRCIGCGLCVTGCPNGAARLERRPEAESSLPPLNFAAWERERLANRGLLHTA